MNKKNRTEVLRSDPKLVSMVKRVQGANLIKNKKFVPSSRITLAIFNQYNKYPQLLDELMNADLK